MTIGLKVRQKTHILNRSFQYTVSVKKKQCIGYIFLLGERVDDKLITKDNLK